MNTTKIDQENALVQPQKWNKPEFDSQVGFKLILVLIKIESKMKFESVEEIELEIFGLLNTQYDVLGHSVNIADLGWKFEWDRAKRRFGRCTPRKKLITISYPLVEMNLVNFDVVRNVVLHEIAHAIHWIFWNEASHNYTWHRIARGIGCDGDRCYSSEIVNSVKSKYTLVCPVCGKEYPKHKKPTKISSCGICQPRRFDMRYKLELIQNY